MWFRASAQFFERNGRGGLKGRNLRQCVHSGVGTARSLRQYIFAAQPSNSRGERALHGRPAGLHLPARKIGSIIRKDEFEVPHVFSGSCNYPGTPLHIDPVSTPGPRRAPAVSAILLHLRINYWHPSENFLLLRAIARNSRAPFYVINSVARLRPSSQP